MAAASRSRATALAGLFGMLLAACSGPQVPLNVDVHSVGTDILLSAENKAVAEAPVAASLQTIEPSFPAALPREIIPTPLPPLTPRPPRPNPSACPDAPPLANPALAAGRSVTSPPAPASYAFRMKGEYTVGSEKGEFPESSKRTIANVATVLRSGVTVFEFDVIAEIGTTTTATRYRIVPEYAGAPPRPPAGEVPWVDNENLPDEPPVKGVPYVAVGTPAQPGVYALSVAQNGGPPLPFNGANGMLLVQLPLQENDVFRSSATYGTSTVAYTSSVKPRTRVNACGTWLQAWVVEIAGTQSEPASNDGVAVDFVTVYHLATQFGGISVGEHNEVKAAAANSKQVSKVLDSVINDVPKAPK